MALRKTRFNPLATLTDLCHSSPMEHTRATNRRIEPIKSLFTTSKEIQNFTAYVGEKGGLAFDTHCRLSRRPLSYPFSFPSPLSLSSHARRYFNIYHPKAGFEISQTDRYSAVTRKSEACVIATRSFEVGEELLHCAGTIAILNEQEEKELENRTSDFSVIKTSRKGTCLFLGPARFVNVCVHPLLYSYSLMD